MDCVKLICVTLWQLLGDRHEHPKHVEAFKLASAEPFGKCALGRICRLLVRACTPKVDDDGPVGLFVQNDPVIIYNQFFRTANGPRTQRDIGWFYVHVHETRNSFRNVREARKDLHQVGHEFLCILRTRARKPLLHVHHRGYLLRFQLNGTIEFGIIQFPLRGQHVHFAKLLNMQTLRIARGHRFGNFCHDQAFACRNSIIGGSEFGHKARCAVCTFANFVRRGLRAAPEFFETRTLFNFFALQGSLAPSQRLHLLN